MAATESSPWRVTAMAAAALLAVVAVAAGTAGARAQQEGSDDGSPGGPVAGSVQQAYEPITAVEAAAMEQPANTEVALPDGVERLQLQAVKVGREAAEPTIGVDAAGNAFFAAGTFDGAASPVVPRTEVLRSTDGGVTWESVQPDLPARAESEPPVTLDPYVYVDDVTGRVFNLELYVGCSYLLYSDDLGETWSRNPAACGEFANDHQTIVAGPRPAGSNVPPTGLYHDRYVYYCFNRIIDANCGRSVDGGATFQPTAQPAFFGYDPELQQLCGGLHGHIATDPDGRLLVPKGHCGNPWIAVSEDAGDSWTRTKVSDVSAGDTHLSVRSDSAGNLYFTWFDADKRLPYLAVSTDHGATWSEPLMIAPPGVTEVNFPVLEAGDPGHVVVNFPGATDPDRDGDTRPWSQYVAVSTDVLEAVDDDPSTTPLFQSATANDADDPAVDGDSIDPIHRGDCTGRCAGLWDFQEVVVAPSGQAWAAAADDCVKLCEFAAAPNSKTVGDGIAIRQIGGPSLLSSHCAFDEAGLLDNFVQARCRTTSESGIREEESRPAMSK